jgi:cobalt-zinc-cadmium efflux system outer membrane protein
MRRLIGAAALAVACTVTVRAQGLTRAQAIEAALARGPRMAIADADTLFAAGQLLAARSFPNPALTTEFTKDAPQYHVFLDIPLDFGSLRGSRVSAAGAERRSALLRYAYARAAIRYDADTAYTQALAAAARAQLSRRNALDADSLRRIAVQRRDAGDASDLDVELASVYAGQQANAAAADALALITTLLDLQTVIGTPPGAGTLTLADSLMPPPDGAAIPFAADPLLVDAAAASLDAAGFALRVQQRSRWLWPSLTAGFETHDPGGVGNTLLPVVGLTIPLPLLNGNRGPILSAQAARARAGAELALTRLETRAAITRALREREVALGRIARDRALLTSADRVAAMSLRAYQEGAAPLATVLESQRAAREILSQYVDDLAAASIAAATVQLVTLSASPNP